MKKALQWLVAATLFGVARCRDIFELAIASLPDAAIPRISILFVSLETRLGEFDRARAIFLHASQYANPLPNSPFWKAWSEFEVGFGNESTYRTRPAAAVARLTNPKNRS